MLTTAQPPEILEDSLDPTVQDALRGVARACGADRGLLWLADPAVVCWIGTRTSDPKGALVAFVTNVMQHNWPRRGKDVAMSHKTLLHVDIEDATCVAAPLFHAGKFIGSFGLCLPKDQWQSPAAKFEQMVPLLAAVIGAQRHIQQVEQDLTETLEHSAKLLRASEIDTLTSLENKASFEAKCKARLTGDPASAAMLAFDLDRFKQVNDMYGHLFGDRYLTVVSEALRRTLPKEAIIGRTGGDEFCALLDVPANSRKYLTSMIRNIRHSIQRGMATLGKPDLGGVSIGVSHYPLDAASLNGLLERADCALYASKRQGRSATTFFSSDMQGLIGSNSPRDGGKGFSFDRLTAVLQPIVDLSGAGRRTGFEVLARWRDAEGNLKAPHSFSWVFRDHRYASELTFNIIESALEQLCVTCTVPQNDFPELWINVTDSDFLNPDFVFDLQHMLDRYGVSWSNIVLEINEDTILEARNGQLYASLMEVRRRGGRVALDDFGAGQTGLRHVCEWPVDIIKIDRTIVQRLGKDERADAIVRAIVLVAIRLRQTVLAEGIETHEQASTALMLGCRLGQGYHFGRPDAAENALAFQDLAV